MASDNVETMEKSLRYSFPEIKEAQRICGEKMTATALRECGAASAAQQQIFRAHVNDLCATVFAAALRKYNPENQEEMAPVDEETAIKVKQLETKLKEKEMAVKKLQERVPRMAAANARRELATARKRHADVLVKEPESMKSVGMELTEEQIEALKAAYVKVLLRWRWGDDMGIFGVEFSVCLVQTASSIAIASAKMSQVMSQTTETISIVEQAMKRPKTEVDIAMENSPVKPKALLNEQEKSSLQQPSPLRTRLALQFSASKNV